MKKAICFAVALLVAIGSSSATLADIIFSSSSSDAMAGSNVTVLQGGTGSIYVWVSTDVSQTITGIGFNILSSDPTIASGILHSVENPGPRWSTVQPGGVNTSGNLLNNHRAFYLPGLSAGTGISTGGLSNFVLHSELTFNALELGTTDLTFTPTTAGIGFLGVGGNQWNNVVKGTGSISVAIPEPTAAFVLLIGSAGLLATRRRR